MGVGADSRRRGKVPGAAPPPPLYNRPLLIIGVRGGGGGLLSDASAVVKRGGRPGLTSCGVHAKRRPPVKGSGGTSPRSRIPRQPALPPGRDEDGVSSLT